MTTDNVANHPRWRLCILGFLLTSQADAFSGHLPGHSTVFKHNGSVPNLPHDRPLSSAHPVPLKTLKRISEANYGRELRSIKLLALQNPDENETTENRNQGILVLMTVPLAWGTFEPVVRYVYAIEPPIPGLLFSPCYYLVAATALSLLSWITSSNEQEEALDFTANAGTRPSPTEATSPALPILGGLELGFYLFLGNALQVLGLKTLNSDRVAFLIQLTTIFVPLVQGITARNLFAIPTRTWIACLIALSGVGVMGLEGNEDLLLQNPDGIASIASTQQLLSQGDFLVIGSALAYTFHCIRLEKYAKTTRAVTLAACKATTETALSVLLVLGLLSYHGSLEDDVETNSNFLLNFASETGTEITSFATTVSQRLAEGSIPMSVILPAVGAVLWTGLVTCGYTIYAQSYGQSRVNPSDANLIYTFQPVWTSLIAFFLLGETLGPSGFIGGALIGVAVFLVISEEQQRPAGTDGFSSNGIDEEESSTEEKPILQGERQ